VVVLFYGRSVLLKLSFHALAKLRLSLCPRTIGVDKGHKAEADNYDRRDLQKNIRSHFIYLPPAAK
jgi:hypothetical protein